MMEDVEQYLEMLQFGVYVSITALTVCLILLVLVLVLNGKLNQLSREVRRRGRSGGV